MPIPPRPISRSMRYGPRLSPGASVTAARRAPGDRTGSESVVRPRGLGGAPAVGGRVGELLLVLPHHRLGQVLAGLVVDRMGEILVLPVRPLAARHRPEQSRGPPDDLQTPDHERVVEGDAHE